MYYLSKFILKNVEFRKLVGGSFWYPAVNPMQISEHIQRIQRDTSWSFDNKSGGDLLMSTFCGCNFYNRTWNEFLKRLRDSSTHWLLRITQGHSRNGLHFVTRYNCPRTKWPITKHGMRGVLKICKVHLTFWGDHLYVIAVAKISKTDSKSLSLSQYIFSSVNKTWPEPNHFKLCQPSYVEIRKEDSGFGCRDSWGLHTQQGSTLSNNFLFLVEGLDTYGKDLTPWETRENARLLEIWLTRSDNIWLPITTFDSLRQNLTLNSKIRLRFSLEFRLLKFFLRCTMRHTIGIVTIDFDLKRIVPIVLRNVAKCA